MTYSTKHVAALFNCHRTNINYYHKKYDIGINQDGRLRWTDEDIEQIKKMQEARNK